MSQPLPMHMQTADQRFEHHYVQSHGYSLHQGSRQNIHPSPPQHAHYHLPSSYAPALAPAHPRSAAQMPEQHHHFQSSFDDVVDVEGAQRFRGQPQYTFHHTQRPSTAPPHAQPGQMHPQIHPADGVNDDEPVSCGVGIVFHSSGHGSLAVKRLVPGGPAARCGLIRQGDILTHIDQTNVYQQNASDINHLISGPQGSFVQLRFKRSGSSPVIAVVERVWAPSTAERSKALSNGGGPPSKVSGSAFDVVDAIRVIALFQLKHFVLDFAVVMARRQQQFKRPGLAHGTQCFLHSQLCCRMRQSSHRKTALFASSLA